MDFLEKMEKEFANMPSELQQKFNSHRRSVERLKKAEEQKKLWDKELNNARSLYDVTSDDWVSVLNRYDFETKELKPNLEVSPQEMSK